MQNAGVLQYFEVLELSADASWEECRQRYLSLVKKWHPDRFMNAPILHAEAEETTKQLNQAFLALSGYYLRRVEKTIERDPRDGYNQTAVSPHVRPQDGRSQHFRTKVSSYDSSEDEDDSDETSSSFNETYFGYVSDKRGYVQDRYEPAAQQFEAAQGSQGFGPMLYAAGGGAFAALAFACLMVFGAGGDLLTINLGHRSLADLQTVGEEFGAVGDKLAAASPGAQKLDTYGDRNFRSPQDTSGSRVVSAVATGDEDVELVYASIDKVVARATKTELMKSAISCDLGQAKHLVATGADISVRDKNGDTALIWAVKGNCLPVVKLLVEAGANVNMASRNGFTALKWASSYQNSRMVSYLQAVAARLSI